ncbi:unnamed protein product [Spirodela intermedia]|uniref:Uncharacterized protein n=1 Tax=Spirodela intermedia TaxID=51605 RepID=A0A7I8LFI6_SPIIN|nr:unnamed protein product [Spirodela intermedia]
MKAFFWRRFNFWLTDEGTPLRGGVGGVADGGAGISFMIGSDGFLSLLPFKTSLKEAPWIPQQTSCQAMCRLEKPREKATQSP